MFMKICECGKLIPQSIDMCDDCKAKQKSRHVVYNETRRDKKAAAFYISKEWRAIRPYIFSAYDYLDIWALYVDKRIITLNDSAPIHHIEELEDCWEKRLDPFNLFPVSHDTHNTITALYKEGEAVKKSTQKRIKSIIDLYFQEAGGIKKVFERLFIVAPPQIL